MELSVQLWYNKTMPKRESVETDCEHDNEHDHDYCEGYEGQVLQMNRQLYLFGTIDPNSVGNFLMGLSQLDMSPGTITINICSGGGWVNGGLAMYDAIRSTKNVVKTVACGAVFSSAVLPFVAGDIRVAQPSSAFLFHQLSLELSEAPLSAVRAVTAETSRLFKTYCDYVAEASKLTSEAVGLMCSREVYLPAADAVTRGIVHALVPYTKKKVFKMQPKRKKK